MNGRRFLPLVLALVVTAIVAGAFVILLPPAAYRSDTTSLNETIALPDPLLDSEISVEEALDTRRSQRSYRDEPLSLSDISQLLWAAQGITDPSGHRTAPSAGALYPIETYVVAGEVTDLPAGIYRYRPAEHALTRVTAGDRREELYRAALEQDAVTNAPATIVLSGVYSRTAARYGDRAERYVLMEAGHVSENIYLQAVSLEIGTVAIGAFSDEEIRDLLAMAEGEHPLYVMPVGKR